jgi:hypothetical protein
MGAVDFPSGDLWLVCGHFQTDPDYTALEEVMCPQQQGFDPDDVISTGGRR